MGERKKVSPTVYYLATSYYRLSATVTTPYPRPPNCGGIFCGQKGRIQGNRQAVTNLRTVRAPQTLNFVRKKYFCTRRDLIDDGVEEKRRNFSFPEWCGWTKEKGERMLGCSTEYGCMSDGGQLVVCRWRGRFLACIYVVKLLQGGKWRSTKKIWSVSKFG